MNRIMETFGPKVDQYKYESLRSEQKWIRLVKLLPGAFGNPICVELFTARIKQEQCPRYEALSYTWGSQEDPKVIYIKDYVPSRLARVGFKIIKLRSRAWRCLSITQNLEEALRYVRHAKRVRTLWIDAICINQGDVDERGRQVEIMGDIYRAAEQTVVWLGPEAMDSVLAVETLSHIGSQVRVEWTKNKVEPINDGDPQWVNYLSTPPFTRETWRAIDDLIDRPWFCRLWIWQEVHLAKTIEFRCGTSRLPEEAFGNAIFCLRQKPRPDDLELPGLAAHLERVFRLSNRHDEGSRFHEILEYTAASQCSDPRDRIYALMNLVHSSESIVGMKPDYSKEPHGIFQDVFLIYWKEWGNLNIMTVCEIQDDDFRLPTWVPNFSKPRVAKRIAPHFASCLPSKAEAEFAEDGVLKVAGVYLATIDNLHDVPPIDPSGLDYSTVSRTVRDLWKCIVSHASYSEVEDLPEAFYRALISNMTAESFEPSQFHHCPTTTACKDLVMRTMLSGLPVPLEHPAVRVYWLDSFARVSMGRCFFITRDGRIGWTPQATKSGDQILQLLGWNYPLSLRKDDQGRHIVVGECYIQGFMFGEKFLGPFSDGWRGVLLVDEESTSLWNGFIHDETGETQVDDPRLGPLPPGWKNNKHKNMNFDNWFVNDETGEGFAQNEFYDPRLTAEALTARGVPVQTFELI